jgi:tetratricopeptide (TPR) repeat protein
MRDLPPPESFASFFARELPGHFVPSIVPTRYTKVIEFARGSNPHMKRGLEFVRANAWEQARQEFSQGLTTEPGSAALHYNLAVTLEAVGDLPAAQREYEQALRLEPSNRKYQQGFRSVQDTIAEQQRLSQQVGSLPPDAPAP